ncbi:sugar dehydrogenase complex small subunit [Pseudomonas indica]|uniref:Membrane bound FAD containing D-sorbitol dehydrogenase n=1 Tax=Pseudomonas indica TaxID=137658 RepID=A0A1G8TDW3_9PSED|nr:sugar dehydrogenase complex small subunit [Pseudomonas indica]MBU3059302.1 sorbitol dehydrogenase family protein [Pseudomonas indica]PAU63007.1 hypothetical protein BZL42_05390 [Pseudomonas indica]SDJ39095.1 Membrane bound FAD containing D-sorbitol dehydrogenase [Pseudomonas indica]
MSPNPLSAAFLTRRRLLGAFCAGTAGCALSASWPLGAAPRDETLETLMQVSRRLTGREALEEVIGKRIRDILAQRHPEFPDLLAQLADSLEQDPAQWSDPLQRMTRDLLSGWYLGYIGDPGQTVLVSYELALMHGLVADVLKPRTYCATRPGDWATLPGQET